MFSTEVAASTMIFLKNGACVFKRAYFSKLFGGKIEMF